MLALGSFYASPAYTLLTTTYKNYRTLTNYVLEPNSKMALWHSFNTTIPTDVEISTTTIEPYYNKVRARV